MSINNPEYIRRAIQLVEANGWCSGKFELHCIGANCPFRETPQSVCVTFTAYRRAADYLSHVSHEEIFEALI